MVARRTHCLQIIANERRPLRNHSEHQADPLSTRHTRRHTLWLTVAWARRSGHMCLSQNQARRDAATCLVHGFVRSNEREGWKHGKHLSRQGSRQSRFRVPRSRGSSLFTLPVAHFLTRCFKQSRSPVSQSAFLDAASEAKRTFQRLNLQTPIDYSRSCLKKVKEWQCILPGVITGALSDEISANKSRIASRAHIKIPRILKP